VEGSLAPLIGGLLTGLREGVESALIVGILAGYLVKIGRRDRLGSVWVGVFLALLVSLLGGAAIFALSGGLDGSGEQVFEGVAALAAAVVVTRMLLWMRQQSAALGGELRRGIDTALSSAPTTGIALLAFTAVIREGLESATFLVGQASIARPDGGSAAVLVGAVTGAALAAGIGWAIFRLGARLNLGRFFAWTGVALIIIAAGLIARGVGELVGLGLLPPVALPLYDIRKTLPDDAGIGLFLHAIVGYRAAPDALSLIAQGAYLVVGITLFLRSAPRSAAQLPRPAETVTP